MTIIDLTELRRVIRKLAREGCIWITSHAEKRMLERNVTMADLTYLLHWGEIQSGQYEGDEEQKIFRLVGTDIEQIPLTAVLQVISGHMLSIITVM